MNSKQQKSPLLKIVAFVLASLMLVLGAYYGIQHYHNYQANRIYHVNETVEFPDFNFTVKQAEFKPVDLPLDKESVTKYGGTEKPEDCDVMSREKTWIAFPVGSWSQYGPSDYDICKMRNDSRLPLREYLKSNSQLKVLYSITANRNISTKDLKIDMQVDSGRDLKSKVNTLNGNQFFDGCARIRFSGVGHIPGDTYGDGCTEEPVTYTPYKQSLLGGDLNKGLSRDGFINTDVRKSENNIDIKISYRNETRIVRITR